jgi:hypothetical protein
MKEILAPKLAYELSDIEFRQQSADYFDGLKWYFKVLKSNAQRGCWLTKAFFSHLLEVEMALTIRLPEYEAMVKACATYASIFIGDLGYSYDLNLIEPADLEMIGSTDDISDLDLTDL